MSVGTTDVDAMLSASLEEGWKNFGVCGQTDPELFFPSTNDHHGDNGAQSVAARKVCLGCPVRQLCLSYALHHPDEMDGVWGATTKNQRRDMRRDLRAALHERISA